MHQKTDLRTIHNFALNIALQAGQLIQEERKFNRVVTGYKVLNELVTSTDLKSDMLIIGAIQEHYPHHKILSEETFNDQSLVKNLDSPIWIIDSLDGTVNYAHNHHNVAVSIAYAEEGEVKVGVVHAPFQNETFTAIRGKGSFLNHKAIKVSQLSELRKALIGTGFPFHNKSNLRQLMERAMIVLAHCADIRILGSAALDICWVACGRLDGYYRSLRPWDFAAARLIAEEAGARCGHFNPVPIGFLPSIYGQDILVSTPELYEVIEKILHIEF